MIKTKIGYIKKSPDSTFDFEVLPFEISMLEENYKNERNFIQVSIKGEDYIRLGEFSHPSLLTQSIKEFGLNSPNKKGEFGKKIPSERGEDYELLGAGKVRLEGNYFSLYEKSKEYGLATNGSSLERIANEVPMKINQSIEYELPYFMVKIN